MKKVLVLSSYCFENASTNGLCAKALVEAIRKAGHSVALLGFGDEMSDVQNSVPNGDYTVQCDREDFYQKKKTKKVQVIKNILRSFFEPLYNRSLVRRYYNLAEALMKRHRYDVVIAVYFPMEPIRVACLLKKKHPEIFFADFELDSATDGIFTKGALARIQRKVHCNWLRKIYKKIDASFVMKSHEEHAKKLYENILGEKMVVTDLPVLTEHLLPDRSGEQKEISFVYAGILDRSYRSPAPLLDLFRENRDCEDWRLHFFSKGNCEEQLRKAGEEDPRIICHGYVPAEELDKAISRAEVLVSIGNQNSNSVPSKIINYISYGKPIIHFCLQKDDVCCRYFEKYPLAFVIPFDWNQEEAGRSVCEFIAKNRGKRMDFELVRALFYENTPEYSADLIFKACEEL